jgi:hypothetical protein
MDTGLCDCPSFLLVELSHILFKFILGKKLVSTLMLKLFL